LLGVDGGHGGRNGGGNEAQTEWKRGWHVNLFKVEMDSHFPSSLRALVASTEIFLICMHQFNMHAY
jgi:hypothetical protein